MVDQGTTSYIIWLVRVVLPIVLFFFWYRSQPKAEKDDNRYSRAELIACRQVPQEDDDDDQVPEELATLRLADEAYLASKGFAVSTPSNRGNRRDGKGKGKGDGKRGSKGDEGKGGEGGRSGRNESMDSQDISIIPEDPNAITAQDTSQLVTLLNFVAFSHKERQLRVYMPEPGQQPPPPPKKPVKEVEQSLASILGGPLEVSPLDSILGTPPKVAGKDSGSAAKLNTEAQASLKGLVNPKFSLKCPAVAKDLYNHLQKENVQPSEGTYSLMVEACVNACDLKSASDFLMKMEAGGFCPKSELLDKVMDLYSESRGHDKPDTSNKSGMSPTLAPASHEVFSKPSPLSTARAPTSAWADEVDGIGEELDFLAPRKDKDPFPGGSLTGSLAALSAPGSLRPGGGSPVLAAKKAAAPPPWGKKPLAPSGGVAATSGDMGGRLGNWESFADEDED
jgi:pentatricopeptide repeat protein